MKNTWIKLIIVSFIIMVLEMIGALLFLRPHVTKYQIFDEIDKGKINATSDDYNTLNTKDKSYVNDKLEPYCAYLTDRYLKGELTYQEVTASLDAVSGIDDSQSVTGKYFIKINENELVSTILDIRAADVARDTAARYTAQSVITALRQRMDSDTREDIMYKFLSDMYIAYLNEDITTEDMSAYTEIVIGNSYYDAYELANIINGNIKVVSRYRDFYNTAVSLSDEQKYLDAIKICDLVRVDDLDSRYRELFAQLRTGSYEEGKTYYREQLEAYVAANDSVNAVELMAQLEEVYGSDIDTGATVDMLASDWQKSYVDFVEAWENNLCADIEQTNTGQYILENKYDELKPDSIFLYDIDGNNIPEMFLFNSARLDEDYVECFIYSYVEDKTEYIGYVNLIALCDDSNLITFPDAYERESGDEYALVAFNGTTMGSVDYCQHIGDEYFVNGEEATDVEFLSTKTDIMLHQSIDSIKSVGYSNLVDAKSFILTYNK